MSKKMSYGSDYKYIPATTIRSGKITQVLPDLYCYANKVVNVVFIGDARKKSFVLVDAGMPKSAKKIVKAVEKTYGKGARPKAILLTHGHFDHVGSIIELINYWKVPVYSHAFELPFLTGEFDYPSPDPFVRGGLIAKISYKFPKRAVNLADHIERLPADGSVPYLEDFRWIHTPGHTPGHVSFFREKDRTLIAGDAFITVKQDSLIKTITQKLELNGPPKYFTTNWRAACESVRKLKELHPAVAITGHGRPVSGENLTINLRNLADNFEQKAIPPKGKYV
ncbi:MBL fold metallo-hydrolase [Bacillus shivajii]|uniref:MBL fold metallo-hydrolase n=1 Tax=Bacillus shivajii TaxID=1983719 RepID=UPI001CF9302D|nr:MBL fold metallo-hydrolase [Bacillus shivajii]UCZ53887.1 MBL fold metallo-hydrolase [Bacillus shivajii]